jgi:hypothetical protein
MDEGFVALEDYGAPELGGVTGANSYFTLRESTRREYALEEEQLVRISPPGTRHLRGLSFTGRDWKGLQAADEPVWLLQPSRGRPTGGLARYLEKGRQLGVDQAYKCRIRDPWWLPPVAPRPDLFFTYMSHRYPRMIANSARVSFLNSMHGVRLRPGAPAISARALPLLAINSVTMLGAELFGRSYGGGVLKMEPREAATLPVPSPSALVDAWSQLSSERALLDRHLRDREWTTVAQRVDEVLLGDVLDLSDPQVSEIRQAAKLLRERRLGRTGRQD